MPPTKTPEELSEHGRMMVHARWSKMSPAERSKAMRFICAKPGQVPAYIAKKTPEERREYCRNMALARWANTTPAERSAAMRIPHAALSEKWRTNPNAFATPLQRSKKASKAVSARWAKSTPEQLANQAMIMAEVGRKNFKGKRELS